MASAESNSSGSAAPSSSPPHHSDSDSDDGTDGGEGFYHRMLEKLGIMKDAFPILNREKPKILEEKNVQGVVKYIKKGKCKNIITLAGAGISTSSGIPDFRSPGSGLYHNLQKYNLPHPQAIFEIDFFKQNPEPFFHLAKELYPGSFKPTVCHYFIRLLHEKGLLLRHFTQNIDTLERVAGLPGDKIVEAHGTFYTSHCLGCKKDYSLEWMKERIFSNTIPKCEDCSDIIKPDIVFFGENLPMRFFERMQHDFDDCDLLIVMGSSLTVQPFASLIDRVPESCPRLLINRTKAGEQNILWSLMGQGSGMDFDSEDDTRDVAWLGDCDDGCRLLANELGWGEELDMLVMTEHMKILTMQGQEKNETSNKKDKKSEDEAAGPTEGKSTDPHAGKGNEASGTTEGKSTDPHADKEDEAAGSTEVNSTDPRAGKDEK